MGRKAKTKPNIRKQEENIVALFTNKLKAIFKTKYREYKRNNYKSNDSGGDKKNNKKVKKISQRNIEGLKREIKLYLAAYGIGTPHIHLSNQPGLSKEQISMIDVDFEGLHFKPNKVEFSSSYLSAKNAATQYNLIHLHQKSDYDLNQIPVWHEMKKFNSFRLMHHALCSQLAKINYPTEKLNQLNYSDMLDLISNHNNEHPEHHMPCQRTRFLKMFADCYGYEFYLKMKMLKKEKEALNFLEYIECLDNPSKKYSPEAHEAAKSFNIHHIKNRKFAEELDDYSLVNNFSNLALCFSFPHHKVLHTPCEIDLNNNIVFFGGFLREFQITRDPEQERLHQQGKIKPFRLKDLLSQPGKIKISTRNRGRE